MKKIVIGIIIGVLIGVITHVINDYSPLFKSNIATLIDQPPELTIKESRTGDQNYLLLFEAVHRVKNSGFKSGRLTRISFSPNSLEIVPKTEVISFYRGKIKPFEERIITTKFIVYIRFEELYKNHQISLNFFDENDRNVGGLNLYHYSPQK